MRGKKRNMKKGEGMGGKTANEIKKRETEGKEEEMKQRRDRRERREKKKDREASLELDEREMDEQR